MKGEAGALERSCLLCGESMRQTNAMAGSRFAALLAQTRILGRSERGPHLQNQNRPPSRRRSTGKFIQRRIWTQGICNKSLNTM